jgi:hypothetical protein
MMQQNACTTRPRKATDYRPLQVCGEIVVVFKKRDKFPKELGGYSDSSKSESE